jgi:hypothetical protein
VIKPGRAAIDPHGRTVAVLSVDPDPSGDKAQDLVTVKLAGPYGARLQFPRSCLRPAEVST